MPTRPAKLDPQWQDHLDFLLPRRTYLRPDEIAAALRIDPKTVDNIFAQDGTKVCPELVGFEFVGRGTGQRPHKRILRDSALLLVANGANYTPEEWRARIVEVLSHRSPRELLVIQAALAELIRRAQ